MRSIHTRRFQTFYNQILAELVQDAKLGINIVLWKHGEDDYQDMFSSATTWEQILPQKDKVQWCNVVWFSQAVPRYAFIAWLVVLNILSV